MSKIYKTSTGVNITVIQGQKKTLKEKVLGAFKKKKAPWLQSGGVVVDKENKFDLPEGTKVVGSFKFVVPFIYHYESVVEIMPEETKPTKHEFIQWFGGVYQAKKVSRW